MKYETPELTALASAINAIQSSQGTVKTDINAPFDSPYERELTMSAYVDWE